MIGNSYPQDCNPNRQGGILDVKKHWKRMSIIGLITVTLLLGSMMEGAGAITDIHYNFKFNGGVSSQYTLPLPNTYQLTPEGQTVALSGKDIIIGDSKARPYNIRGHYRIELSDQNPWNERRDAPCFQIAGVTSPIFKVFPGSNPFGAFSADGDFEIPANQVASLSFNSGHYLSRFLGFLWVTNQWGVSGRCTIDFYLDSESPDPPRNVKLDGASDTKITTGGTIDLSWEAPGDKPTAPTATYEASGIKGYKIFDGDTDITPGGGFITGLNQTITLAGEYEHTLKILAYDNEENASNPATVYARVDQTPPTGKLSIQSNSGFTNQSKVTLSVTNLSDSAGGDDGAAGSGLSQVGFSNNNVNYTWVDCTQTNLTHNWDLSAGDGPKTVYLKLKDRAGNITADANAIPAAIVLDTTPPIGSFTINNGAAITNSQQVILTMEAEDNLSGMAGMMFSNDGVTYSRPEAYTAFKAWILSGNEESSKIVYVKFTDKVGNTSTAVKVEIGYNSAPVFPGITPVTTLAADEEWSENRTINGQLVVPAGVTLTISPGMVVTFDGPANCDPCYNGLIIEGTLIVGTGVTFSAHSSKPGWMGIIISGNANMNGANISLAQQGLTVLNRANVTVDGCSFSQNFAGIRVYGNHPVITNCVFQGNTYGIKEDTIGARRPTVSGCTFIANSVAYYDDQSTWVTIEQLNKIPGNGGNR